MTIPQNYLSFLRGKSFLKQALFHGFHEVSIGFGGTIFSKNDIGETRLNRGTKKFQEEESTMDDVIPLEYKSKQNADHELR